LRCGRATNMHLYLESLSLRQRQILPMVVAGQSAKEIGRDLNLSHRTVEKHRKALMEKLGVSSISELIRTVSQAAAMNPDIFKFD
ncbi:MAG: helix-turn-helix transcriptional regulator, partial [Alphaproteobacteria bacterium]